MKLQLAQMQQAESVQDSTATNTLDLRLLYAGGIVVLGGLAFLVYKRFNNEPTTPQMSPVKPRPRPPALHLEMD